MSGPCLICGRPRCRGHHPTGQDAIGAYLDPEFRVPLCHDDHMLLHDDWHTLELATVGRRLTDLERVALRLRRLASFFARLLEGRPNDPLYGFLARAFTRWADKLERTARQLDRRDPEWRSDPGFYPEEGEA